jgi:hypothetical protein
MSSIEQKPKPDYIDKTYITRVGDEIVVRKYLCHRCNKYIKDEARGYPVCQRESEQERKMEERRIERENDLKIFGEVIHDDHERHMRLHPDFRDTITNKSWNMMLAEKEQARKQAYHDRRAARQDRKERRLPDVQRQYNWLKAQVIQDEQDQIEDDKAEEARLREQQKQ